MLTYILDKNAHGSLYESLYEQLKNDIMSGRLKYDEKLPSKRALAENLGISTVTVENAYYQLIAEGYVVSRERSGYFVNYISDSANRSDRNSYSEAPDMLSLDLLSSVADSDSGQVNSSKPELFPFNSWTRIMRRVILEYGDKLMLPLKYNGVIELRSAIADFVMHFRGIKVSPDQIVIGSGAEYLYNLIIQLLGRDKHYAIETPGYSKIRRIYELNNAKYTPIPIDKHGLNFSMLKNSGADIAHISPAHHYPTGIIMPINRRLEILSWAKASSDRYIIEDDYDSELRYSGKPVQTMFDIDGGNQVIYLNTFSQTLSPSLRVSYMCLPPKLMVEFKNKLGFYSCPVPGFEQYTLASFISGGYFERHISRLKTYYNKKRTTVMGIIKSSPLYGRSELYEAQSGLHFLLKLPLCRFSDDELKRKAATLGIQLSFLSDYCIDKNSIPRTLVINYANLDTTHLPQTLDVLNSVIDA